VKLGSASYIDYRKDILESAVKISMIIVMLGILLSAQAFAETEVSGEVSGEWTVEGSPYIILDSTWVPEGESLTIGPGVDVLFSDVLGLDIFGSISVEGTEDDSVRFMPGEGCAEWRSIDIYFSEDFRYRFEYCSIVDAFDGIKLTGDCILNLSDCNIHVYNEPLWFDVRNIIGHGITVEMADCSISGRSTISLDGVYFEATDCDFRCGRAPRYGFRVSNSISLEGCSVLGSVGSNGYGIASTDYIDCEFIKPDDLRYLYVLTGAGVSEVRDCYVEGDIVVGDLPFARPVISDCEVMGAVDFTGTGGYYTSLVRGAMERTRIEEEVEISYSLVHIVDCECLGGFEIEGMVEVQIDSCIIGDRVIANGEHRRYQFIGTKYAQLTMEHSVLLNNAVINGFRNVHLINNTIVMPESEDAALEIKNRNNYESTDYSIINNIIHCQGEESSVFNLRYEADENLYPTTRYNCFWGFDEIMHRSCRRLNFEPDSSNIIEDPQFVSIDSLDFHLTEDSPCIDAGDPDSPRDPDGTRADMGAYYYNTDAGVELFNPNLTPDDIVLKPYPNPFNSQTNLSFSLPNPSSLSIDIYDLTGRRVQSWGEMTYPAGHHRIIWSPQQLPSGSYFVKLAAGDEVKTNKITLLK